MNKYLTFRIYSFLQHWFSAQSAYLIHSPFVYHWYREVLRGELSPAGKRVEQLRKTLTQRSEKISFDDLGAGSSGSASQRLGILVKRAARKRNSGELLRRMVKHCQVKRGLELGTHVGISTLYVNSDHPFEEFVTIEGIEGLAQIAQENFKAFDISPRSYVGSFDEVLEKQLDLAQLAPDFVFIDGNHRYEPTLRYFHQILPFLSNGGIMVFDDIYWSREMKQAWEEIITHEEVSVSIDLYFLGICFIRRSQAKEHFRFRFWDTLAS